MTALAASIPVNTDQHCLFVLSPVYTYTKMDKPPYGVDLLEALGVRPLVMEILFRTPIGAVSGQPIDTAYMLENNAFEDFAESIARFGVVDRERELYWRIDRSDVELSVMPATTTSVSLPSPSRVFVFTPTNQKVRYTAITVPQGGVIHAGISIVSLDPDPGIIQEAEEKLQQ